MHLLAPPESGPRWPSVTRSKQRRALWDIVVLVLDTTDDVDDWTARADERHWPLRFNDHENAVAG